MRPVSAAESWRKAIDARRGVQRRRGAQAISWVWWHVQPEGQRRNIDDDEFLDHSKRGRDVECGIMGESRRRK